MSRQPILRKHPYVDVDADSCAADSDRIRTILQDMRDRHFRLCSWKGKGSAGELLRGLDPQSLAEKENGVDRVRIVQVIRRDPGRVRSARWLRLEHLIEEAALLHVRGKDLTLTDVLITYRGSQVLPSRILRIGRRVSW